MNQKQTLLSGALLGLLGVALGAFGAHALKALLVRNGRLDTYELAVRYQFYHALLLLFIGILMEKLPVTALKGTALWISGGVILFSGSLYLFALSNVPFFAMVTPVGGVLLLIGWGFLFFGILKSR